MKRRSFLLWPGSAGVAAALAPLAALSQSGAGAQPLRIIVATPPGGASDAAARVVAQALASRLGRQVIVDNRPGGNGVPAVQAVLSAPTDGSTLLWAMSSMAGMPLLVKSAPVASLNEFVPVAPVMEVVYGLVVNPKVPATNITEFNRFLKANPDRLSYATGVLSEYLLTMHYLRSIGATAVRVPYKGGAQLLPDLIRGEVQFNLGPLAPALPHIRSGKLRVLATLPGRSDLVPGAPSLSESGVSTEGLPNWNGLVAAPRTPSAVAARIADEVNKVLLDPAVRSTLEAQGFRVSGGTPRQMEEAMTSAATVWRQFVREYDIPQE